MQTVDIRIGPIRRIATEDICLRPLKNYDTLAMVVVFGTKTNLAVEYALFFREPVLI